jgi:glutamine---fructose-6-phosphate transaminase (isomerizing)
MCGIFGGAFGGASVLRGAGRLEQIVGGLFRLSESRGKEAAGLALANHRELAIYKAAVSARRMIRSPAYRASLRATASSERSNSVAFIGHSRLVTDGGRELNRNNQPVLSGGVVGVHNGIIVNHAQLWREHPELARQFDVDSEIIVALLRSQLELGTPMTAAAQHVFAQIAGTASVAALFADRDVLLLGTNNGSLYHRSVPGVGFVFGSESYILSQFAHKYAVEFAAADTVHLRPGEGALVDLQTLALEVFSLREPKAIQQPAVSNPGPRLEPRRILDRAAADPPRAPAPRSAAPIDLAKLGARYPYVSLRNRLQRCARCVLPETMPFVDFDARGVCAYCRAHQPLTVRGHEALEELVRPHRRSDGRPDCIVGVSGGRDSIYGLHYLKTVLRMNPVAYTYDWGMVTDLARRNTSRVCGQLGVEHILVSADIPVKRQHIRANVEAWLERPSLGTVPLFMAGDKAYFYFLNRVREQLGLELAFLCENLLERTDFKTGFAGVPPVVHDRDHVYTLAWQHKLRLLGYYAAEFARNPRYLNQSLLDTVKAFAYYYGIDRNYHNLYGYVPWDEATIARTLLEQYGFERANDTESLWRIGDGTAAFYNFIYYAMAGMTENDTFRSNQIRNGALEREAALHLIERDNRPRFPSIQWYLATIGLERSVEEVIEIIERAPKLHAEALSRPA